MQNGAKIVVQSEIIKQKIKCNNRISKWGRAKRLVVILNLLWALLVGIWKLEEIPSVSQQPTLTFAGRLNGENYGDMGWKVWPTAYNKGIAVAFLNLGLCFEIVRYLDMVLHKYSSMMGECAGYLLHRWKGRRGRHRSHHTAILIVFSAGEVNIIGNTDNATDQADVLLIFGNESFKM